MRLLSQEAESVSTRRPGRYPHRFQLLAVLLVFCVVVGIVLAVQVRQHANGQTQGARHTPTPTAPLNITR